MGHASRPQQFNYISSCIRHQSHRLRQLTVRRRTENLDWQTAAGHEHRHTSHQPHTKIQPGSDVISARGSTLAGRPTTRYVQAVPAGVQVSTWLGTAVSSQALCTGHRCHAAPKASFCHSRTTEFSSVQHEKLRPTGILVRRPSCLELTAGTSATNYFSWPFQALTQDVFIQADIAFSALKTSIYLFNGLYKFSYLLTYFLLTSS